MTFQITLLTETNIQGPKLKTLHIYLFYYLFICWLGRSMHPQQHLVMAALWNRAGHYIFVLCFLLSIFFFFLSAPILSRQKLDVYHLHYGHTWCGRSANLECKSEMCCMRLAENTERKKSPKIRHLGTIAQLCQAISSQLTHYRQSGKKTC